MPTSLARRALFVLAALVLLVPALACGTSGDDDTRAYRLERCGLQLRLGPHFTQSEGGPERYTFVTADSSLAIAVEPAPPGDPTALRDPRTFLPATAYDYERASSFAGLPAREARTQRPLGNLIETRWVAAIDAPQGLCYVRVTSRWNEGPDQMGEGFWTALHDRWITRL